MSSHTMGGGEEIRLTVMNHNLADYMYFPNSMIYGRFRLLQPWAVILYPRGHSY